MQTHLVMYSYSLACILLDIPRFTFIFMCVPLEQTWPEHSLQCLTTESIQASDLLPRTQAVLYAANWQPSSMYVWLLYIALALFSSFPFCFPLYTLWSSFVLHLFSIGFHLKKNCARAVTLLLSICFLISPFLCFFISPTDILHRKWMSLASRAHARWVC